MNCRKEVSPFSDDFGRLSPYEEVILRAVALERSTFKLRLIGKVVDDKNTPLIDASGRLASIETTAFGPTAWETWDPSEDLPDLPDIETIPDPPQIDPERAAVQAPLPMTYSATNGAEVDYQALGRAAFEATEDVGDGSIEETALRYGEIDRLLGVLATVRWPHTVGKAAEAVRAWQAAGAPRTTDGVKIERWWSERYKEARDARRPLEGAVEVRVRADASPSVLVAVLGALGPLVGPLGHPLPLTCSIDADGGESFVVVFPQEKS